MAGASHASGAASGKTYPNKGYLPPSRYAQQRGY